VTQVVASGPLRRFQFLIPASLAPGVYRVWLTGTGGTTTFSTLTNSSCSAITVTSSVQGTASLGAAISGAAVTLKDASGNSVSGTTASDGTFALNSAGLTPPFLVKVVLASASGQFPAGTTLYSVSADGNASSHINVNVLTDLLLRSFYSAQGINPDAAFASPLGGNAAPSPVAVLSIANLIIPAIQLFSGNDGITLTPDTPASGALNVISSPYVAFPAGLTPPQGSLDLLLHQITTESLGADGAVTFVGLNAGTATETVTPVYGNGQITLNTMTSDSGTAGATAASSSALALTVALTPVIDGVNALLAGFASTVNAKGSGLVGSDLRPFVSDSYLNDGIDAAGVSAQQATELAGQTVDDLHAIGIRSFDAGAQIADVTIAVTISSAGQTFSGTDRVIVRNEAGSWKLFGNQRLGEAFVGVQARVAQGAPSIGLGVFSGTFAFANLRAPHGVVTQVTISGPTSNPALKLWNGNNSMALFQGAQVIDAGVTWDEFFALSTNLGSNFNIIIGEVPPGSPFTFSLATTTSGNQQYAETSAAVTTELVQFTTFKNGGIPLHVGLAGLLNQAVSFKFSVPRTYPVAGVSLRAQIRDGAANDPNAHSCFIESSAPLTLDFGTHTGGGTIAFPANMSACDPSLNSAIAFIDVFLEADGTSGETSLAEYSFPY